jgi:tRNA(fMet)-specific endonuclease VapC
MVLILDTNALSAIAEGNPEIVRRLSRAEHVVVPVVVLGEFRFGIAQSRQKGEYERWLNGFLSVSRVLEIDESTSVRYAELRLELKRAGAPIPSNDLWIAALCRQHRLPILTRDRHFDVVKDLVRMDW